MRNPRHDRGGGRFDDLPMTADERETEALLAGMRPAAPGVDRDRLMFLAGQVAGGAAARRQLFAWRMAAAVLLGGIGLAVASRPGTAVVERERIVYRPVSVETLPATSPV